MINYENVTQKDETSRTESRWDETNIRDKHKAHKDEFLYLLYKFEVMLDGHLRRFMMAKHQIEPMSNEKRSVYRALYCTNATAVELAAKMTWRMIQEEVTGPSNT